MGLNFEEGETNFGCASVVFFFSFFFFFSGGKTNSISPDKFFFFFFVIFLIGFFRSSFRGSSDVSSTIIVSCFFGDFGLTSNRTDGAEVY